VFWDVIPYRLVKWPKELNRQHCCQNLSPRIWTIYSKVKTFCLLPVHLIYVFRVILTFDIDNFALRTQRVRFVMYSHYSLWSMNGSSLRNCDVMLQVVKSSTQWELCEADVKFLLAVLQSFGSSEIWHFVSEPLETWR